MAEVHFPITLSRGWDCRIRVIAKGKNNRATAILYDLWQFQFTHQGLHTRTIVGTEKSNIDTCTIIEPIVCKACHTFQIVTVGIPPVDVGLRLNSEICQ